MKLLLALAAMILAIPVQAQTPAKPSPSTYASVEPLLSRNGCTTCHAPAKKVVGPSFKDVARKYSQIDGAGGVLLAKIRGGSSGAWGSVPMPPNSQANEQDLRLIAQWIAGGAPLPE
ncbi:MAG: cyt 2 [Ramlibacter sp.]|nr:cyt 2 [Ramlibacter sp.]